jgi:hypothetical protein
MAVSHLELLITPTENWPITTTELASVSPINPWSDTREMLQLLHHCWNAWRYCWCGHVTLPHSCIIQVFIAVAGNKRGDVMSYSSRLGSAQRKHCFVYCCVIVGACFDVTVLAWRKYATILSWFICVTIDRVWIGGWIYRPLTPNSELQVITVLSLISTLYKSPQHQLSLFPACCLHQPFPSNSF